MKRLCFFLMLTLLAFPNIVKAERLEGINAEKVMLNGKLIGETWSTEYNNSHYTRVIYNGRIWACRSTVSARVLELSCTTSD